MSLQDETVRHRQLQSIVSEHLRLAILDGDYQPGEWLRQKRIAEELGVSQMPVREALKELAADGLVEHVPYRGVRVIRFSPEDVADLYANRSCLESMAAKSAAENISAAELDELRSLCSQMKDSLHPAQISEYRHLNRRFHQAIYNACGRDYLSRTLNQLWLTFPMMLLSSFPQTARHALPERDERDLEEHKAIIVALENRDGKKAERLMQQHIEGACDELLVAIRSGQGSPS
jgi:DNA-binding GntR family transcriptional regulator